MTVEKLRGFVADQAAKILEMDDTRLMLQVEGATPELGRRRTDRPTPYLIELQFQEIQVASERREEASDTRTLCHVSIRPTRERDRRRDNSDQRVRQLLGSLKAYLMAQDYARPDADGQPGTAAP